MKPVLILTGGRAGDISTLKYTFVAVEFVDGDARVDLLARSSVFLTPWESAETVHIPEGVLCRGKDGLFYIYANAVFTFIDAQDQVLDRFKELVMRECVLF